MSISPKFFLLYLTLVGITLISCPAGSDYKSLSKIDDRPPVGFKLVKYIGPAIDGTRNLDSPVDISFSAGGRLFICDNGNDRIVSLDKNSGFLRETGGGGLGEEQLSSPIAIAFDHGLTLLVADNQQRKVKRFDRSLNFIDWFYQYTTEDGSTADVGKPMGIYVSSSGYIFLSDGDDNRVLVLDGFYKLQQEVGGFGYGNGELSSPRGIITDPSDKIYIADSENGRVAIYNNLGEYLGSIGDAQLKGPIDIARDRFGYIYVSDKTLRSILIFSQYGEFLMESASSGIVFGNPMGMAFSPAGELYIADEKLNRIVILSISR